MIRLIAVLVFGLWSAAIAAEAAEPGPTHPEIEPIRFDLGPSGKLETIAMDAQGRLLAGVSWIPGGRETGDAAQTPRRPNAPGGQRPAGAGAGRPRPAEVDDSADRSYAVKIISAEGRVIDTWPMTGVEPKMLHGTEDGEVYVAGNTAIARFDAVGKLIQSVPLAGLLDGRYSHAHSSGITANEQYVFVALGEGRSLRATEDVVRFDRDLSHPRLVVETQFGCCSHIDLDCRSGELLVAENSRHRVNRFTFDGELLGRWGRRDRESLEGFAACCNPVNFDFGPEGVLYTAESGIGRIKKYRPDGEFLGLVGYVDTTKFDQGSYLASISCYIPVEVSQDGKRVYVMDVRQNMIRVLAQQ